MTRSETGRTLHPKLGDTRVLVVEDNYFMAQHLCQMLRTLGVHVMGPAPSIAAARRMLADTVPDCVLLDVNLDGELTFELAAELRQTGIHLVFVTGYDAEFIPRTLHDIACLQKPVEPAALLRGVMGRRAALPA